VRTLTGTLPELKRDGVEIDNLDDKHFIDVCTLIAEGGVAKEAIDGLLRALACEPKLCAKDAAEKLGLGSIDLSDVESMIESVIKERQDFVKEKGMAAVGPLMGVVMKEVRGKVDGKTLSEILKQKVNEHINA
jgi:glutamyl-tRNA(Gln) amidotransferase subunit E